MSDPVTLQISSQDDDPPFASLADNFDDDDDDDLSVVELLEIPRIGVLRARREGEESRVEQRNIVNWTQGLNDASDIRRIKVKALLLIKQFFIYLFIFLFFFFRLFAFSSLLLRCLPARSSILGIHTILHITRARLI